MYEEVGSAFVHSQKNLINLPICLVAFFTVLGTSSLLETDWNESTATMAADRPTRDYLFNRNHRSSAR